MVRLIASIVGAAFVLVLGIALFGSVSGVITDPVAPSAESVAHKHPKELELASNGVFGKFDRRQLQRGFQVYKEVCSACHSLRLVSFRDLQKIGYSEPEVKAIANQWQIEVPSINPDTGEPATRKAIPADRFPSPYANEVAARAATSLANGDGKRSDGMFLRVAASPVSGLIVGCSITHWLAIALTSGSE